MSIPLTLDYVGKLHRILQDHEGGTGGPEHSYVSKRNSGVNQWNIILSKLPGWIIQDLNTCGNVILCDKFRMSLRPRTDTKKSPQYGRESIFSSICYCVLFKTTLLFCNYRYADQGEAQIFGIIRFRRSNLASFQSGNACLSFKFADDQYESSESLGDGSFGLLSYPSVQLPRNLSFETWSSPLSKEQDEYSIELEPEQYIPVGFDWRAHLGLEPEPTNCWESPERCSQVWRVHLKEVLRSYPEGQVYFDLFGFPDDVH